MSYYSKAALPISRSEFAKELYRCKPPTGWLKNIGSNLYVRASQVANMYLGVAASGGPDSTCLLFLLHRYLNRQERDAEAEMKEIISITVDHGLQKSSAEMAKHTEDIAHSMGMKHITREVPWDRQWSIKRPMPGQPFEATARLVRYHELFQAMVSSEIKILATGHHADDQVETALLRLARGSTEYGVSGMKHLRRWGMGTTLEPRSLGWAGLEGMDRWLIRPLLNFTKVSFM